MTDINIYRNEYCISTDKSKLNLDSIHQFLSQKAYWSLNIPKNKVWLAIQNSLCFGVYKNETQVGLARIISDYATIAYLGDVYILEEHRGKGLSKWLLETIMSHPDLQGLRRWILITGDAHELYRKFGWVDIEEPNKWMEINYKDVYSKFW